MQSATAAVRATIDGYEAARQANGPRDSRHRIEHIELIDRADVPRFGPLGIVASHQPSHPAGAMDFPLEPALDKVGRNRWPDSFLVRELVEAGAPLCFASDWPVTDVSVLRNIQAALTRVPYEGAADQRIGLMEVLRAYTAGGAWAAHREHVTGRLVPGLAGDLVLLGDDIEAGRTGGCRRDGNRADGLRRADHASGRRPGITRNRMIPTACAATRGLAAARCAGLTQGHGSGKPQQTQGIAENRGGQRDFSACGLRNALP